MLAIVRRLLDPGIYEPLLDPAMDALDPVGEVRPDGGAV